MKTLNIIFALTVMCISNAIGQQAFTNVTIDKYHGHDAISFTLPREANVFNFRIEGGNDGNHFDIVGVMPSTGNAVLAKSYHYNIYEPMYKYYRVVMVGMDSKMSYSSLVTANSQVSPQENEMKTKNAISGNTIVANQR